MYPFLDLANAGVYPDSTPVSGTYITKAEPRRFGLRAQRRFATGEQVTISYGENRNVWLLFYYGFVIHRNPYDYFHMGIQRHKKCPKESKYLWLDEQCRYKIYPTEVSRPAFEYILQYFADDKEIELESLETDYLTSKFSYRVLLQTIGNYRDLIASQFVKEEIMPLRKVSKLLKKASDSEWKSAYELIYSMNLTKYAALRKIDRMFIEYLCRDL